MNNIEKTQKLLTDGKVAICNPAYLPALPEQQEKSMLGQRTAFLAFHRFIFNLPDMQIYRLWDGYKTAYAQAQVDFPDEICCDLLLLSDAIQYQIAVRDDKEADSAIAEQIAISFHQNVKLARSYDEITSDYLIDLCKQWMDRSPHRLQPGDKIALKQEGEKADGVIQMRCKRETKGRFVEAARKRGQKLTDFMLEAAEKLASETLTHG